MKKFWGGVFLCLTAAAALAGQMSKEARDDNGFAFALFGRTEQGQARQNIFMSPYSVSIALQMLCNGATGRT
ncbi:MAG: serpin family protein, partial [Limisphaerales bacterium]